MEPEARKSRSGCPISGAGFGGRDLVGRDLVACSRFWARDRVATAVVRGASPFWKSSFVRATNRHGRDHPANLPLSLGVVGRPRRVAKTPGCQFIGFPGLPSPSSRQSQCTHLRIPRPPLVGGAVPRCPRSPVQTSAPVPVPVPVFASGSNSGQLHQQGVAGTDEKKTQAEERHPTQVRHAKAVMHLP